MKIQLFNGNTLVKGFLILAVTMGLASCGKKKTDDSKAVAEEHNEAKFDKGDEKDAQFLVNAAEINLEEIQLGQLAQKNGMMPDVRELGKAMEAEHTKALAALKQLAAKKLITVPVALTQNGQDAYQKLIDKPAKDFDKAYCDMMVDGHKKAVDKFESVAADGKDSDIRSWASSMLPVLRSHLDHAMVCQAKCTKG